MTVYEWTESEHFFIAQVRPAELFVPDTLDALPDWDAWSDPDVDHGPEGRLGAVNLVTGREETFAYIVDKRAGRDWAERTLARYPDKFVAIDTRDLGKLAKLTPR